MTFSTMGHANKFDLGTVLKEATACHPEENVVLLDKYLAAYCELARFFDLLGPIFGFVAKDLRDKIDTLQQHQKSDHHHHYRTVQSMMKFEVENKYAKGKLPNGSRSGSRLLMRLHRPLQFITEFMRRFRDSDDTEKIPTMAMEVYHRTLAKHHMWIIRKMAGVAVYTLPGRRKLMETLCKQEPEKVVELITPVVDAIQIIYDEIEELYKQYDLLQLW
ncbi:ceramide-1-phosphate transfer protein-like [Ptychodera flava]|uniref:ceramide-1-phosphate transfer protein-like n=1 Tax=Ptychodera flava TaxID=63121 RepID=UPI003969ECE0